jgi:hypothetical protein
LGFIINFLSIDLVENLLNNLNGLMIFGLFISFLGTFQDVATDSKVVDSLTLDALLVFSKMVCKYFQ